MSDEQQLFAQFAASRSDTAFAAIVKLHAKLVFATAIRQVADRALAEEVTQNVFLTLARKADSLDGNRTLAGWLYQTTLNQSRHLLRTELRRRRREEIATACADVSREGESIWAGLIPLLDEALVSLREADRLAVILHYMEGRPLREVGLHLGVGEDAARKRVNHAIEWLIEWFQKRGIAVPTSTLVAALSLEGIPAISGALASSITTAAAATSPSAAAGAFVTTIGIIMASTKTKIALAAAALAFLVTAPLILRERNTSRSLSAKDVSGIVIPSPTVRLPDDGAPVSAVLGLTDQPNAITASPPRQKSFLERLNDGDESLSLLSREQADAFLARNRTNAESLLAAYRVTHDPEYLRRAGTNFPNDPRVLFRVAAHNAVPEEQRAWLDQ